MVMVWYLIVHVTGNDFGAPYGHWVWYDFWSGISGSFLIALTVWLISFYSRHTCHTWWCWRRGAYDFTDQDTGLTYKLCRVCHPHHSGKRLTRARIADIHAANEGSMP
jgi:hypothetical protein